jgi:fumarate hydratase subunit beta
LERRLLVKISAPLTDSVIQQLRSGDSVSLNGQIYAARDAAHRRLVEALERGEPLPFDPVGQIIYYMGPTPARPGMPIGAAGPTTSYRLDPYAPRLLEAGVKGMIGKGNRSPAVREAIRSHNAVYFAAIGGAGALIAKSIKMAQVIAYEDLGVEALRKLLVEDFPLIVINDAHGGDAYEEGQREYARS